MKSTPERTARAFSMATGSVTRNDGVFREQAANHFDGRREADVVGIGLEGQAQDADLLFLDDPQRLAHFFDELIDAALIDGSVSLSSVKSTPWLSARCDERLNILGQAESAKTEAGIQELRADARIQSHGASHFLDVAAQTFAEVGKHIGVGNLEAQERVRGVLDQLGAGDGGDQKCRAACRAGRSHCARGNGICFEDRLVNFAQLPFRFVI